MKKIFLRFLGISIYVIILSCVPEDIINGSWYDAPIHVYRFNNGIYEELFHDRLHAKGTYTTKGGKLTITITHFENSYLTNSFSNTWGSYLTWEEDMVPISQARTELINQWIGMDIGWFGHSDTPEAIEELRAEYEIKFEKNFGERIHPRPYKSFSVKDDTLILSHEWGKTELHKVKEEVSKELIETIDDNLLFSQNAADFEVMVENGNVTIVRYTGTREKLIIPAEIDGLPVTVIGKEAFLQKKLTDITIPNSVKIIGEEAFRGNRLTNVTVPDSVTEIGREAFAYQSAAFRTEGRYAFFTMTYKDEVTIIEYNGRGGNVIIPEKINNMPVVAIEESAFTYSQISQITIPNTVRIIGNGAFEGNSLTDVNIPDSVISIGHSAFSNNPLRNVAIPNSVVSMGNQVFDAFDLNPTVCSDLERRFGEDIFVLRVMNPDGSIFRQ